MLTFRRTEDSPSYGGTNCPCPVLVRFHLAILSIQQGDNTYRMDTIGRAYRSTWKLRVKQASEDSIRPSIPVEPLQQRGKKIFDYYKAFVSYQTMLPNILTTLSAARENQSTKKRIGLLGVQRLYNLPASQNR